MPLVTLALCCYAAGLLVGFGGFSFPAIAVAICALVLAVVFQRPVVAAAAALVAAGAGVAFASAIEERRCVARVLAAGEWQVTLQDAAAPGAFVRARASAHGCVVPAALSVRSGAAPAGAVVRASGLALPSRRGVRLAALVIHDVTGSSALDRARASAGRRIDTIFRGDAAMARALLVADRRSLDPALRERFATAGIAHLLSISGLHVGIIAMALQLTLGALRVRRRYAMLGAALITGGYVILLGAPAPALRAGLMLAVVTASRLLQRPTSPWAALAVGGGAPLLLRPAAILEPGYQLTVSGMAAIIAAGSLTRRWIRPRLRGWTVSVASAFLATVLANLVTAPVIAWHFGAVSVVAPLTNLIATPLVGLLQPVLFLALVLGWAPAVARFVADAAHPLLLALDGVASLAAGLPLAAVTIAPTLTGAMLGAAAAAALVVACTGQRPAMAAIAGLSSLAVAAWLPLLPSRPGQAELHMIDVGQGDAIALRTPRGRWILFDAGRSWRGGDTGRGAVIPYVRRRGGEVVAFVLSHPHDDHVGGAPSILRALRPHTYVDGAYVGGSATYLESLREADRRRIAWRRVRPGDTLRVDGVLLRWLAPDSTWLASLRDPNDGSVIALVEYGTVRFLLTGDAERAQERWLLDNFGAHLRADVLKVAHHGSSTSSTPEFLSAVAPRLALISVGVGNRYGHPSPGVLNELAARGAEVLRTDAQGTLVVRTDGRRILVEAQGDTWSLYADSLRR